MIKLAHPDIPEEAIRLAEQTIRSGNLVQGEKVCNFEKALRQYLNVNHAIAVSSGTAALHLSLLALGIKSEDEVLVPAFSFPATANAVELLGAKPVFVDISLDDFCMDSETLQRHINQKTKAILPVHEFGQAADIEKIKQIAQEFNLKIVEDAACALGTEFKDKKAGTFGDIGCFSFHPRKALTTGEGGLVVTNDDELAHRVKALRNHGIVHQKNHMQFIRAGLNYRMTEFQAALGLPQLYDFDKKIDSRIKIAKIYDHLLSGLDDIQTPKAFEERKMVYQTYHILINKRFDRDLLIKNMYKKGIETNIGAHAIIATPFYREKYKINLNDYPHAMAAFQYGLALPIGSHLDEMDIKFISEKIIKVIVHEKK